MPRGVFVYRRRSLVAKSVGARGKMWELSALDVQFSKKLCGDC